MSMQPGSETLREFRMRLQRKLDSFGENALYYDVNEFWMLRSAYEYIEVYAVQHRMWNTSVALPLARALHNGMHRKSSITRDGISYRLPYFIHPLLVCRMLLDLHAPLPREEKDLLLASALCHDMIEDIPFADGGRELVTRYGLDERVYDTVKAVSKRRDFTPQEELEFFRGIERNKLAMLVKLSDRGNNVEDLYNMKQWKVHEYIGETEHFFLPMCAAGKTNFPELSLTVDILEDKILCLSHAAETLVDRYCSREQQLLGELENLRAENDCLRTQFRAVWMMDDDTGVVRENSVPEAGPSGTAVACNSPDIVLPVGTVQSSPTAVSAAAFGAARNVSSPSGSAGDSPWTDSGAGAGRGPARRREISCGSMQENICAYAKLHGHTLTEEALGRLAQAMLECACTNREDSAWREHCAHGLAGVCLLMDLHPAIPAADEDLLLAAGIYHVELRLEKECRFENSCTLRAEFDFRVQKLVALASQPECLPEEEISEADARLLSDPLAALLCLAERCNRLEQLIDLDIWAAQGLIRETRIRYLPFALSMRRQYPALFGAVSMLTEKMRSLMDVMSVLSGRFLEKETSLTTEKLVLLEDNARIRDAIARLELG